MKTILSALAIAAASTALAVESSNTFGILRVDSTAAETVVAIPWVAAGTGTAIAVKDVVKTAGLNDGDQLYYYNDGNYKLWVLEGGAWKGATSVKGENGGKVTAAEGDNTTLARGGAIILVRSNPAAQFYLYGQYTTAGASVTPTTNGKSLIAPPLTTDFDLNKSGAMTGTPSAGDMIIVDLGTVLTYNGAVNGWSQAKTVFSDGTFTTTYDRSKATIPAGKGVWYVSKGESVPTFNF